MKIEVETVERTIGDMDWGLDDSDDEIDFAALTAKLSGGKIQEADKTDEESGGSDDADDHDEGEDNERDEGETIAKRPSQVAPARSTSQPAKPAMSDRKVLRSYHLFISSPSLHFS